jgi:methylamine dehydrogenase heavy chain
MDGKILRRLRYLTLAGIASFILVGSANAGEPVGKIEVLPATPGEHWFWVSDIMTHRANLFDADSGKMKGAITAGSPGVGFIIAPHRSHDGSEIYIAESYFSRGVRGERTDVVTVYDGSTLMPEAEIQIPPKRAEYFPGVASSTLSDDGRYLAVFNAAPAQSITIVDVRDRRFVEEVDTIGCACVYNAGTERFFTICADGSLLQLTVGADEGKTKLERIEPFFEPMLDPMTEKGARDGDVWYFPSFDGQLHAIDVSGEKLQIAAPWSLLDATDREAGWRIGGNQITAIHEASNRLFVLMHRGPKDTHKDAGEEIWVYDLAEKKRVQRITPTSALLSTARTYGGFTGEEAGLTGRVIEWVLEKVLPNTGVNGIYVSQDDQPRLVALSMIPPALVVYDALTGVETVDISEPGTALGLLLAP